MTSSNNNKTKESRTNVPMSTHINKVTLMGSLEEAPRITSTRIGKRAFVRLATIEFYTDDKGESRSIRNWHSIVTFDESLVKKLEGLKPGAVLYIEGRNRSGKYEQDGIAHYTYDVEPLSIDVG